MAGDDADAQLAAAAADIQLPRRRPDPTEDPPVEELEAEFSPLWRCWRGVSGLVYARRLKTSPPVCLRDENTTELRAQIVAKEAEITDRWYGRR